MCDEAEYSSAFDLSREEREERSDGGDERKRGEKSEEVGRLCAQQVKETHRRQGVTSMPVMGGSSSEVQPHLCLCYMWLRPGTHTTEWVGQSDRLACGRARDDSTTSPNLSIRCRLQRSCDRALSSPVVYSARC